MRFIAVLLIFLCSFSKLAHAQEISYSGVVLEKGTRKPLAAVNIFLLPAKQKIVTDAQGGFSFKLKAGEDVQIVINLADYKKYEEDLDTTESDPNYKIYLERQDYSVFETTVSDARTKKDDSQQTLKQADFIQAPGSNGDPVKAIQNLPGIARPLGFSANVVIQGGTPDDTRYNVEGMDVPLIFHFGGLSSIVQPEAVGTVDLLSAGYGAAYSDALGGHVGLTLREPQTDRMHGMAFVDFFNTGGLFEGPISDTSSFMVGGRYSYIGDVIKSVTAHSSNSSTSTTVAPIYYDLHGQYVKKLSVGEEFRLVVIDSHDDLALVATSPSDTFDFHYQTEFWRVIPEWRKTMGTSSIDLTAAYGVNNVLVDLGTSYTQVNSNQLSLRGEYDFEIMPTWKTMLGVDTNTTASSINVNTTGAESFGPTTALIYSDTVNTAIYGLYWKNDIKSSLDSAWTYSPGLRVDDFTATKQLLAAPRLAVKYDLNPSTALKFLTGLYYQQPEVQELSSTTGNPNLTAEQAMHFALGVDETFSKNEGHDMSASALAFYKKINQFVDSTTATIQNNGQLISENYVNDGDGYIQGLELSGKMKRDRWGLTLNYTFSQSFLRKPGQSYYPSPYDQTHALALLGSYKTENWEFGGRARYVTGNPYTPVLGGYYNDSTGSYIPNDGSFYSTRMPAFFQLDARADRKWVYDTWIFSLYLDVQNITNQANVETVTYSYNYSQSANVTGLPILPTFGLKGEF